MNYRSLRLILSEWTSGHSYANRVANLSDKSNSEWDNRLNDNVFLVEGTLGTTVTNGVFTPTVATVGTTDGSIDKMTGSSGTDWFFTGTGDVITDQSAKDNDTVT